MSNVLEIKIINATEFNDFLNLSLKPMFLNIDKKKKNQVITNEHYLGMLFLDIQRNGFIKINSLDCLATELRRHSFIFDKNWDKRAKFIQSLLYP
ncbi:hypothetical protein SLW70_03415 [Flavobacterium sp. NG2]|uniref:hypothetical protein n=1 Tax=Flavobacterium sp. NG2 TaxID=3097547 RepID=UPI002A812B3F|nr:hypothetical protein [Flavobacterium sp. NG2]WPR72202.1 hypothetical protein SLW70_03415 [Flavobacterium sp. NG2]